MNDTLFGSVFRKRIIFIIIIGFFAAAVIQLFSMQILDQPSYSEKSDENSVRPIRDAAPRGLFFDRNHKVLVGNKPSFSIRVTPAEYNNNLDPILEAALDLPPGYIKKILKENESYSKYLPRRIKKDVDFKSIAWYEENSSKLPGVDYVMETQRDYSFGVNGSHMFGYTKEISSEQLAKFRSLYDMGDNVGYNGIEKTYENILRGEKGVKYVLVDSKQKTIGRYNDGQSDKEAVKGDDLILSIDKEAQEIAEKDLEGRRGAVVAIEPSTGEVLAFVSAPGYDLKDFASVTSLDVWRQLNFNEEKPLFNRATMSVFSPGSTYKMVSALAALEEGVVDSSFSVSCPGGLQFGDRFFKCLHVHGRVDLKTAIEKSCNTYFYQLILKIGLDNWSNYSKKFGFGKKTGIDISEESAGLVPDRKYYDRAFGVNRWPKGLLLSLGIGQGELSVTPIQLAQYAALIANYGKGAQPHFLKGYVDNATNKYEAIKPHYIDMGVSRKSFEVIRDAMFKVVNGAGTATNIRSEELKIAGKTGTAQNPHGEDHALFIGFAPYDNPKIAVAVLVENAGFGSTYAAPIARDVIKAFLIKDQPQNREKDKVIASLKNPDGE